MAISTSKALAPQSTQVLRKLYKLWRGELISRQRNLAETKRITSKLASHIQRQLISRNIRADKLKRVLAVLQSMEGQSVEAFKKEMAKLKETELKERAQDALSSSNEHAQPTTGDGPEVFKVHYRGRPRLFCPLQGVLSSPSRHAQPMTEDGPEVFKMLYHGCPRLLCPLQCLRNLDQKGGGLSESSGISSNRLGANEEEQEEPGAQDEVEQELGSEEERMMREQEEGRARAAGEESEMESEMSWNSADLRQLPPRMEAIIHIYKLQGRTLAFIGQELGSISRAYGGLVLNRLYLLSSDACHNPVVPGERWADVKQAALDIKAQLGRREFEERIVADVLAKDQMVRRLTCYGDDEDALHSLSYADSQGLIIKFTMLRVAREDSDFEPFELRVLEDAAVRHINTLYRNNAMNLQSKDWATCWCDLIFRQTFKSSRNLAWLSTSSRPTRSAGTSVTRSDH